MTEYDSLLSSIFKKKNANMLKKFLMIITDRSSRNIYDINIIDNNV